MTSCPVNHLMSIENFQEGAPYSLFRELRQDKAVAWEDENISALGGHWNVFSKECVDKVMKSPAIFSNAGGPHLLDPPKELIQGTNVSLNLMDAPLHRKNRSLVDHAFKPAAINRREDHIRQIAARIIDEVIDKGQCEFVGEVAQRLPLAVICWILGVPETEKKMVCDLANTMMLADDPDFSGGPEESFAAQAQLVIYGAGLAADHRLHPRDSLTMDMLLAKDDDFELSDHEYGLFFLNLIIGGIETTRNSTAFGLAELIRHPDQYQMLTADPALIPGAVDEIVRFRTPITYYRRTATQDVELAGEEIKQGDTVICWLAAANHDEQIFEQPERFDITRCQRESVRKHSRSFGVGPHFCIGVHLARLQLNIMFEEITTRMCNVQFVEEPKQALSVFVDGYKEMQISFDKA